MTPKQTASQRTKNRLQEHGPNFIILKTSFCNLNSFIGEGILVKSEDGWFGWLPVEEINL